VSATRRGSGGCVEKNEFERGAIAVQCLLALQRVQRARYPGRIPACARRHLLAEAIGLLLLPRL
jgi:hypothetical protein